MPVGPVDQLPILAEMINAQQLDCREVCLINMDEYLTDEGQWIAIDHPLSFRGFMDRLFYDRVNPELAPKREHRVFPNPDHCNDMRKLIDSRARRRSCKRTRTRVSPSRIMSPRSRILD